MADDSQTVRAINWREVFPFVNLFRGFRVAVHPSKLVLALVALICMYTGGRFLDWVWPEKNLEPGKVGVFENFFRVEISRAEGALLSARSLDVVGSTYHVLAFVRGWYDLWLTHWVFALIFSVGFLMIWSLFGGAISRIAAVHVARDEKISVRQALRFSGNKILSFIFAPLIPVLITLAIGVIISAVSFVLFHISVVGPIAAGLFWILALLGGLVMTLVVLGLGGGLNLMYPTVAAEGSDSFDAISRSFSYVFARPWRMAWYTLVSLVYGGICFLFVRMFIWLVLILSWKFAGWWLTSKNVAPWYPEMFPKPSMFALTSSCAPHMASLAWSERVAAFCIAFWNYLLISLLGAFAISFYFSISTITYYLMRREVDATELEDVYVEEAEDELADSAPIVASATVTTTVLPTDPVATPAPESSLEGEGGAPPGQISPA